MPKRNLKFHFAKLSFALNLIKGLEDHGVNVNRLIHKSQLRYFRLDNPELMIPVSAIYDFVEKVRLDQGIDQMAKTFANYYRLDDFGAYGTTIFASESLISMIKTALKYQGSALSHEQITFKIYGATTYYGNSLIGNPCQGQNFLDNIDLIHQFNALKMANSADWTPIEIHLTGEDYSIAELFYPEGNYKIVTNQKKFGVVFETSCLANSVSSNEKVNIDLGALLKTPSTLSNQVKYIINSFSPNYLVSMGQMAEMMGVSEKTFKRILSQEDESFSEIVNGWRLEKAIELLANNELKINEISDELYYSSPSNFIRAFKRWTGLKPTIFR